MEPTLFTVAAAAWAGVSPPGLGTAMVTVRVNRLLPLALSVPDTDRTVPSSASKVVSTSTLGGLWRLLMGTSLIPLANVWPTILFYSLCGGALVGGLGSMFSIRKHLNV